MRITVPTVTVLLLAAGCGKPFNEQIDLVGTDPLPALAPDAEPEPLSGTPSLRGWDRRHWPPVAVQVPLTQTETYRHYAPNLHLRSPDEGGPWDRRFPTAVGALDDQARPAADVGDAVVEPFWAAGLLVWAPIDMVILQRWPWQGIRSPREPYDAVPPASEIDPWPWLVFDGPSIQWTDEGAGAGPP